jgi:hypothetical protein
MKSQKVEQLSFDVIPACPELFLPRMECGNMIPPGFKHAGAGLEPKRE